MPSDEDDRMRFPQRTPSWNSPAMRPSSATISLKQFYILIKQEVFYYIFYSTRYNIYQFFSIFLQFLALALFPHWYKESAKPYFSLYFFTFQFYAVLPKKNEKKVSNKIPDTVFTLFQHWHTATTIPYFSYKNFFTFSIICIHTKVQTKGKANTQ